MCHVPPDWLIIEAVIRLQGLKRHENNPTAMMIHKEIIRASGVPYTWEYTHEKLEDLASQRVLMRTPGSYRRSVRFRIHPDYYPEEPLKDPYTEAEREALRRTIKPQGKSPEDKEREARARKRRQKNIRAELMKGTKRQPMTELYKAPRLNSVQVQEIMDQDPGDVWIIDTETTGLNVHDNDILELSIINGYGQTIYTGRFNSIKDEWPEAQAINRISPQDVRGLPLFVTEAPRISGKLRRARVIVGYNVWFDIDFLNAGGVIFPHVPICDIMDEFARVYGEWADWIGEEGGYKWQKLTTAGQYYNIDTKGAHGSLRDCEITLGVLKGLAKEPERNRRRVECRKGKRYRRPSAWRSNQCGDGPRPRNWPSYSRYRSAQ